MKANIGLVGCGYWGKNLVRNFSNLNALKSICDSNKDLASKLSAEFSIPTMTFDEMLNDNGIEAVVIASSADSHASLALACLNANKHIFIEKPIAMNINDANLIVEKAEETGLKVMIGHIMHYHPIFKRLKEMTLSGDIGDIRYIYSNRMAFGKFRNIEDVIYSIAPHDVSMILSLMDEFPKKISSNKSSFLQEEINDIAAINLEFANNRKAHINVSWLNPFKEQKLVVIGSDGMIVFDDTIEWKKKLVIYKHKIDWHDNFPIPNAADPEYIEVNEKEPLNEECKYFINLINSDIANITDAKEGRNVLKVLEAARKF